MSTVGDVAAVLAAAAPVAKVLHDIVSGHTTSKANAARAMLSAALELTADELRDDLTIDAEVRAEMAFMAAKLAKRLATEH